MTYHILYNVKGGPVESLEMEASEFAECEERFLADHPDAEFWTIGIPLEWDAA